MSLSRNPSTIVGSRLRARREQLGWSLEQVGVALGLDESSARARISRYELGVHEPPEKTAIKLAEVLKVPLPYLYCANDRLAEIILAISKLAVPEQTHLLVTLRTQLQEHQSASIRKR